MSTTILSDLITAIEGQVESSTGFTKLPQVINPEANSRRFTKEKYGVIPLSANQVEGSIRYYTIDHEFRIKLSNEYIKTQANDTAKRVVTNALYNKCYDIYARLIKNKAGMPNIVMNIKELSIAEPEYFENEDTVVISMGFIITYRIAL